MGSADRPRLSVFRSNRHIWTQLVDDESGKTLVAVSGLEVKGKKSAKKKEVLMTPMALAQQVGELLAEKALEKKINSAIFDRGPHKYHGLVKALAEGARKGGLKL